jgi:hypothetical protein
MAETTPPPPATTTAHDPLSQTLALLQPWIDYVPKQQRRLGLFIVFALMLHIAAFFFIRIDSSRAELQHQVRIHVSVEAPQAVAVSGQPADLLWDRLTDPRLFILPLNPLAGMDTEAPPVAINSTIGSKELPSPAPPEDYREALPIVPPLEQRVEAAMRPARQPFTYDETPPAMAAKTVWSWDDTLAQRQPMGLPDLPSPVSDTDLSPTRMRVAVGPDGTVQHVLVDQPGSGDYGASIAKDLDQQAVLAAKKIRFLPSDHPGLQWGRVTVFWHYAAKPREEVVPTPPAPSGP